MKTALTALVLILSLSGFSCYKQAPSAEKGSSGRICYADSGKDDPYHGPEVQLDPDSETKAALQFILSATNWPKERLDREIELKAGNTGGHTAASFLQGGKLVILYEPTAMLLIAQQTRTDWAGLGIIAHEIGHHKLGHLQASQGGATRDRKAEELAADKYSGKLLRRLGASLEEAQKAVSNYKYNVASDYEYPEKANRLQAVANGWTEEQQVIQRQLQPSGRSWDVFRVVGEKTGGLGDPGLGEHWTDIGWLGDHPRQGWLSAVGRANERAGKGFLYYAEGDHPWKEIAQFETGINFMSFYPTNLKQGKIDAWLAGNSGMYSSKDGQTWMLRTQPGMAFNAFADRHAFSEIYAGGWPGIVHWSIASQKWAMQYPTGTHAIDRIKFGGSGMWAVGQHKGGDQRGAALYHLETQAGQEQWSKVYFDTLKTFHDLHVTTDGVVLIVGPNGVLLRGQLGADGQFHALQDELQVKLPDALKDASFHSITVDADGMLWLVGDNGVIAYSRDEGKTWAQWFPVINDIRWTNRLWRIRFMGNEGWIVGDGIVLRGSPIQQIQKTTHD